MVALPTRRDVRAAARRAALAAESLVDTARRRDLGLATGGGGTIVLLHNTLPPVMPRLTRFVSTYRERVVDFEAVVDATTVPGGSSTVDGSVAFSFDDGFRSNLEAARLLADRGISAVFYIPTDVVGLADADVDVFFRRPQAEGVMTWDDVESLVEMGHVVGSHSRRHDSLAAMTTAEVEDQIAGSVDVLRTRLGVARHYAWPFGALRYAPVADVVRICGDLGVVPASGVRGRNLHARYRDDGYLRRDAVDPHWMTLDTKVFLARSAGDGQA